MTKDEVVRILNEKVQKISSEYTVFDDRGCLVLKTAPVGWIICYFFGFDKDVFTIEGCSFSSAVEEMIMKNKTDDVRLAVAQVFYQEGYKLLGELGNERE